MTDLTMRSELKNSFGIYFFYSKVLERISMDLQFQEEKNELKSCMKGCCGMFSTI